MAYSSRLQWFWNIHQPFSNFSDQELSRINFHLAKVNNFKTLEWLQAMDVDSSKKTYSLWKPYDIASGAAIGGHLDLLKSAFTKCTYCKSEYFNIFNSAVIGGHLPILQWSIEVLLTFFDFNVYLIKQ